MTPRELLRLMAAEMAAAGVPDAEVDASLLLSHITGKNPMNLRLDSWSQVSLADAETFRALCEKRKTRTPLQYLTGVQSFLGRDFHVDERVLIPRPETELLAERAIALLREEKYPPTALDLCCGSGCLAISMALGVPSADVHAADLSEGALAVTKHNAERLHAKVTLHQGDLFSSIPEGTRFDAIVSNPPYIPAADCLELQEEVRREPMMALDGGADGYDFYRRIAEDAPRFLKEGGVLLLEVGYDQAQGVMALCRGAGFREVMAHEDYQHIDRMVEARL
ncbi:MAG: peptide chain release factor N(5)-glutamine methyltransferase [Clostridiales bacterium]|nr:peptide chain release factor N(5)-glutamine methyltransferase [Clostridiales bacterium]